MRKLEDLQRALSEGRIDRRKFIKQATAFGMAAAIPLSVQMEEAKAAAPKRGGKLRQAARGGATSDSLEGAQLIDTHNINTSWQIRNNLTEVTADSDVTGELAESWETNKDASIWVFKLRNDVLCVLIVAEFDSLEHAQTWIDADPNVTQGVFSKVNVKPFLQTLP